MGGGGGSKKKRKEKTQKRFCAIRSQTSTGHQAKQDGLREEVEEAWRRLESIKVSAGLH